jgi:hypothetical protein
VKRSHQLSALTKRIERRYGAPTEGGNVLGPPGGVVTENPGSEIPANCFTELLNGEYKGNSVVRRWGSSPVNQDEFIHDAEAYIHPVDFRPGSPFRLWFYGPGCPGQSAGSGFFLGHYDPEQSPNIQRAAWYQTALEDIAIALYGGQPMLAVDSTLRKLNLIPVPWGTENISLAGAGQDVTLVDLSLAPWSIVSVHAMIEFDGLLFLACTVGSAGAVFTWDGKTLREDLPGIAAPNSFGLWRDSLVMGFSGTSEIRIRARGESPGTWATVTPGAGTINVARGVNSIRSYRDVVYLADDVGGDVWSYDGTTLVIARSPAGAVRVQSLAVGMGKLWYGYATAGAAILGSRDSAGVYTDVARDLSVVYPGANDFPAMEFYRNSIVAGIRKAAQSALLISGDDPATDDWETSANVGTFSNTLFSLVPM